MKIRDSLTLTAPVLGALLFSGWAIGRLSIAIAGSLFLGLAMTTLHLPNRHEHRRLAGIFGAILGGLALLQSNTPPGTLPPFVLSPLAGALSCMAIWACLARNLTIAWGSASVLVACATSTTAASDMILWGGALLLIYLCALIERSSTLSGLRTALLVLYCVFVAYGTKVAVQYQEATEGWLYPLIESLIEDRDDVQGGLGFDTKIKLNAYAQVSLSDQPVLDVEGESPRYLRSYVMDVFDGQTWTASEDITQPKIMRSAPPHSGQAVTLSLLSDLRSIIPTPAGTMRVQGKSPQFTEGWLTLGSAQRGDVISLERYESESLPQETSPHEMNLNLPPQLAEGLRPYAQSIVGDASAPLAQAAIIEDDFTSHYRYALQTDLRGDAHPLIVLIRDKKPAYCIYYASAMAALLRSNHVHSRVVGGFLLPPTNSITGHAMVRRRHAHAWVEVWSPSRHTWVTFDPTPAGAVQREQQSGLSVWFNAIRDTLLRVSVRFTVHPDKVIRALITSWPTATLFLTALLWVVWMRTRGRFGVYQDAKAKEIEPPEVQAYYLRYQRLIKKYTKLTLNVSETENEFIDRLGRIAPSSLPAAQNFLSIYQEARYGHGDPASLVGALKDLEERLTQRKTT